MTPELLASWIIRNDDDLLVINKPGWVVCHPSKNGPWSSLVGACREYVGLERLHLVSRLDRETSGLVILAKHKEMASILQSAVEHRKVHKLYYTILKGKLEAPVDVDQPLAKDINSPVYVKQIVREDPTAQSAKTRFEPISSNNDYTFAKVIPTTGRKHQIRTHALWLGHYVIGDKLYGPDETLYLEFIEKGWTPRLENQLPLKRQALHSAEMLFEAESFKETFSAPLAEDMIQFCKQHQLA
ncbi:MAG: hypothetical protein AUJ82_07105 [Verrucomicrobia bacterium CG1_02_43_26]|nr:MAG: hypothetical protein AUJ82_07105 [Verrucomicrobia bacterium CG1_02_43_26]